ncbi:MAG: phosphoribosylanthranilate isomerase [Candidatus Omnitrophica bacterium]|nr:phosphoribosylanthranilate isomerase [Candidatus Omnitrophota bacterium]
MTKAKQSGVLPVPHSGTGCRIKICGITNYPDAAFSVSNGAFFIGFIFYKRSLRYITPLKARAIIKRLPKGILKAGVFVNEKEERVKKIADICGLDLLQFHGDEPPGYLAAFKGYSVIKALRIKDKVSAETLKSYNADYFLFDTYQKGAFGGTGQAFDWDILKPLKKTKTPFFVSGGLTPDNASELVRRIGPFAVDVSSGVEKAPGKKDHQLIKKFIKNVKS